MVEQIEVKHYTFDRLSMKNKRITHMTSQVTWFGSHIGFTLKPIKILHSKEVLVRGLRASISDYSFSCSLLLGSECLVEKRSLITTFEVMAHAVDAMLDSNCAFLFFLYQSATSNKARKQMPFLHVW